MDRKLHVHFLAHVDSKHLELGNLAAASIEAPLPCEVTFDTSMGSISNGISICFDGPMLGVSDLALFLV